MGVDSAALIKTLNGDWVIASIQFRAPEVRSGMLRMALLDGEELGQLARDASRELPKVKVRGTRGRLRETGGQLAGGRGPVGRVARHDDRRRRPAGPTRTPVPDQYTIDLTERAARAEIDPVIG